MRARAAAAAGCLRPGSPRALSAPHKASRSLRAPPGNSLHRRQAAPRRLYADVRFPIGAAARTPRPPGGGAVSPRPPPAPRGLPGGGAAAPAPAPALATGPGDRPSALAVRPRRPESGPRLSLSGPAHRRPRSPSELLRLTAPCLECAFPPARRARPGPFLAPVKRN